MPQSEPIRVIRGHPTTEELAALVVVLVNCGKETVGAPPAAASRWWASGLPTQRVPRGWRVTPG